MSRRSLIFALVLSAAAGGAAVLFVLPKMPVEISRQELITEAQSGSIREVVITDGEVLTGVSAKRGRFRMAVRRDDASLFEELSKLGVDVKFETEPLGLI